MVKAKVAFVIGFSAALALVTGCGSSGAVGLFPGGQVAGGGTRPVWERSAAWTNLVKLTNYSWRGTIVDAYTGESFTYVEAQHSPDDFKVTENGDNTSILAGGHYYYSGGGGPFTDFGVVPTGSVASGLAIIARTWPQRLNHLAGAFTGPCMVAARSGDSFRLQVPPESGIKSNATACVDKATGVLLSFVFKVTGPSVIPNGLWEDTFQVTGIGNVPPIPAPPGAQPHPASGMSY